MGKKLTKKKVGRPIKITEDVVKKLEAIFRNGANIEEACSYAGISKPTYYDKLNRDRDFLTKMQSARYYPTIIAKNVVLKSIKEDKNVDSAKWYLERRARKEFSTRSEITGDDGKPLQIQVVEDTTLKEIKNAKSTTENKKLPKATSDIRLKD